MDQLYIVELKVEVADGSALESGSVYDRLVTHATAWLSRDVKGDGPDLSASGQALLPARRGAFEFVRNVRWTVTHTERLRAVTCVMRQPVEGGHGSEFICEFTLLQDGQVGLIRVELGRESVDGLLSPVTIQSVRRPGLLTSCVRDRDLRLTYQGQVVDGRFTWVNPPEVTVVKEALASEKRLPILLIDGGPERAKELGRETASQLAGLARVLLVDRRARALMADYLGSIHAPLPDNGARLVWPVLDARHPEFWDLGRIEVIAGTLMKLVASVSVAARGTNRLRVLAAEERRREQEAAFRAAVAEVSARGDQSAELDMLRGRVTELDCEVAQWMEEVERLSKESESFDVLESQLAYWKSEAHRAYSATGGSALVVWETCPELVPDDLSELAQHLEAISDGAIVFTAAALRSWRKSGYPHVDAMQSALVVLAQGACEWRNLGCQLGMPMKEWLKTRFELNFSSEDEPLVRKKLHEFTHDGSVYLREPHLKLDDHVKPNEVGRVYFAVDSAGARFVVDHVGLKLYGI